MVCMLRAMTLASFLAARNLDAAKFAHQIGVKPEAVRRYLRGERIPRPYVMARIVKVTEGHVTPSDFYGAA